MATTFLYRLAIVCDADEVDPQTLSGEAKNIPAEIAALLQAPSSHAAIRVLLLDEASLRIAREVVTQLANGDAADDESLIGDAATRVAQKIRRQNERTHLN